MFLAVGKWKSECLSFEVNNGSLYFESPSYKKNFQAYLCIHQIEQDYTLVSSYVDLDNSIVC